ncbi:RlpA-like double-psi beta-barrel domain-containing protein [Tanacetum coccineum]
MKSFGLLFLLALLAASSFEIKAQTCKPSGGITGKKPPAGQCNRENDSDCCVQGKEVYGGGPSELTNTTTQWTHQVGRTINRMYKGGERCLTSTDTIKVKWRSDEVQCFEKGGDGGGPSECDKHYHSDDTPVVALSTGWYKGGDRCHKYITINGNGRSVKAMVVDECDSTMGCDDEHDYQPPCPNNIVDASKAVWKALGVSENNWGDLDITWSE